MTFTLSGLVVGVSGLVLGCLDLFFCVWTCISGDWTSVCFCVLVGCDNGVHTRGPGPGDPGPYLGLSLDDGVCRMMGFQSFLENQYFVT